MRERFIEKALLSCGGSAELASELEVVSGLKTAGIGGNWTSPGLMDTQIASLDMRSWEVFSEKTTEAGVHS